MATERYFKNKNADITLTEVYGFPAMERLSRMSNKTHEIPLHPNGLTRYEHRER